MPDVAPMNREQGLTRRETRAMRRILSTDAGMARFLTDLVGAGNWTYDPGEDVWVVPDDKHTGPGRGYMVMKRGGDWFKAVLPDEVMS